MIRRLLAAVLAILILMPAAASALTQSDLNSIIGNTEFYNAQADSCPGGAAGAGQAATTLDVGAIVTKYGLQSALVKQIGGSVLGSNNPDQSPDGVASVLKLIIADAFLTGKPDLGRSVTVTGQENYFGTGGGDGSVVAPHTGQSLTLGEALEQTLKYSSDTDANVLIDAAGGLQQVNNSIKTLGYAHTTILSYYNDAGLPTISANQTTVTDLSNAMEKIYTNTAADYLLAHDYLHNETVKFGLDSDANKWGGTSKVTGNSAVFLDAGKSYIITVYVQLAWKGDRDATDPSSGATAVKNATNDILAALRGTSGAPTNPTQCCAGSLLPGSTNEEKVWNYFVGTLGFSAIQAAGAMGNIKAESGFNPTALNPGTTSDTPPADSSRAWGLAQWVGGRQLNLISFAADQGKNPNQLDVQLNFLKKELEEDVRPGVLTAMKAATTIEQATRIWLERFESPCTAGSGCDAEQANRLPNSEEILARLGSGGGAPSGGITACGSSSGAVTGGYSLPVDRHWYDEHPDWFTKPHHDYPAADIPVPEGTNVYAIVAGKVRAAGAGAGGGCGQGLTIDAVDGASYNYCHGSDGGSVEGAHVGDDVVAGQLIMHSSYTGHVEPPGPAGAHLHVGIFVNGINVCPQSLLVGIATGNIPSVLTLPTTGCFYSSKKGPQ